MSFGTIVDILFFLNDYEDGQVTLFLNFSQCQEHRHSTYTVTVGNAWRLKLIEFIFDLDSVGR